MSRAVEKRPPRFPAFRTAFLELKGDMTTVEFAKRLGMSRATVGFYEAGERIPDALGLAKIAITCAVSTDYLLGLSPLKTIEMRKITAEDLSFSQKTVEYFLENVGYGAILNEIVTSKSFDDLMFYLVSAINERSSLVADHTMNIEVGKSVNNLNEEIKQRYGNGFALVFQKDVVDTLIFRTEMAFSQLVKEVVTRKTITDENIKVLSRYRFIKTLEPNGDVKIHWGNDETETNK